MRDWFDQTLGLIPADNALNRDHPMAPDHLWLPLSTNQGGRQLYDIGKASALRHGTLTGALKWAGSPYGPALLSTGAGQYADLGVIEGATSYTISALVNVSGTTNVGQIFSNDNGSGVARAWQFRCESGGLRLIAFSSGNTNGQALAAEDIRGGGWRHVAGTWDGTTVTAYIDGGRVVGTAALAGPYANTMAASATLGDAFGNAGSSPMIGQIAYADLRIGVALPAASIFHLCDLSRRGFPGLLNRFAGRTYSFGAAGGTFNPAWAAGCNRFLGPGIMAC